MEMATVAQVLYYHITLMFVSIGVCQPLQDPINGKIFLQGNIAFFVCFPGTAVMGNPILTCINGNWNNPPPTCELLNP